MRAIAKHRAPALVVAAIVGLTLAGWFAARQIKSPARIAADTAPPKASDITVPVVRRTLASEVIVRGTVRYGEPQDVVLATSKLKQDAAPAGSDIVTRAPRLRQTLGPGAVAMTVSGRPVFVLPGGTPMHRDLHPGVRGQDVRQLELELARRGLNPGAVDGRYDSATAAAVSGFYLHAGWDPFGATDFQVEKLQTAEAAAATARDARLQAQNTIDQALRTPTRAEVTQARIDAVLARDAVATAVLAVNTARAKLASAKALAVQAPAGEGVVQANNRRDQAVADADVAAKRGALLAAMDDEQLARAKLAEVAPDAPQSERTAAAIAVRQASDAIARGRADLDAAIATADAIRAGAPSAVDRARGDVAQAVRDVRSASAELYRAVLGVRTARSQATLAALRARLLARPTDTRTLRAIRASTGQEAARTQAVVARLAVQAGIAVPANEVLFFQTVPVRVDLVKARLGSAASGTIMTVTNSRLAVDSSLSVDEASVVRRGNRVKIDQQDLGIKSSGTVTQVADRPGTNKVDPSRVYFEVTPTIAPVSLAGTSVKLTIAVKTTRGAVLAVPPSALSLGGDGTSRVEVRRGGRLVTVTVVPGLAAGGLVEVRPAGQERLAEGDRVVVGSAKGP